MRSHVFEYTVILHFMLDLTPPNWVLTLSECVMIPVRRETSSALVGLRYADAKISTNRFDFSFS